MKNLLYTIITIYFAIIIVNAKNDLDANWMSYLDPTLKLNQIHIPGTHDSGTYAVNMAYFERFAETQLLSISEQLELGIRFLDIRVGFDDLGDEMYLCHGRLACRDRKNRLLYLRNVLNDCISFLNNHPHQTIIAHISRESDKIDSTDVSDYELGNELAKQTILDESLFEGRKRNEYFYYSQSIPTLGAAYNKIVIFTSINK